MISYAKTKDPTGCCGCRGCETACSKLAISFQPDFEGFQYPRVNPARCNDCGSCAEVCPIEHPRCLPDAEPVFEVQVYAALNKDRQILGSSSSGGLFSALAKDVLDRGGVVFGAAFDKDWAVRHEGIESWNEMPRLRVSKYVQSDTGGAFAQVRKLLKAGKLVYFTGVPCQVAGLKRYLRRKHSNLLTTDIVCHGVPSPKVWQKYLDWLGKPIYSLQMRLTDGWGVGLRYSYRSNNKRRKHVHWLLSPYLYAFLQNLLHRPVCYACPFARPEREGDVTLGDYWGVKDHHPEIPRKKGVSLVLVNNPRGEKFFGRVRQGLDVWPSRLEWAVRCNGNLLHPSSPNIRRSAFYRDLDLISFGDLAKRYMRPANYWSFLAKTTAKNVIKKILGFVGVKRFKGH